MATATTTPYIVVEHGTAATGDRVKITRYGGRVSAQCLYKTGTIVGWTSRQNPIVRLDQMVWTDGCFNTDIVVTPAAQAIIATDLVR